MTNPRRDPVEDAATPRWVKLFFVGIVLVVALFVVLHLTGNAPGPGSHLPVAVGH